MALAYALDVQVNATHKSFDELRIGGIVLHHGEAGFFAPLTKLHGAGEDITSDRALAKDFGCSAAGLTADHLDLEQPQLGHGVARGDKGIRIVGCEDVRHAHRVDEHFSLIAQDLGLFVAAGRGQQR